LNLPLQRWGTDVCRKIGTDIVPEAERQAATKEFNEMGYEIDILPGERVRQCRRAGAKRHDLETLKKTTPRMMELIQAVRGVRQCWETLVKSKEFQ
jgi:hypothetical protein